DVHIDLNLVAWSPAVVSTFIKGLALALVGLLALLCRTPAGRRTNPRLLGEFALVVLTMLFISERSWKHHYVTVLLPYTYLAYRFFFAALPRCDRLILATATWSALLLMATTSSELGGLAARSQGHKLA